MSWARQLSGRSSVRYTTGPATRAALHAAGAAGASSGDVVHLPHRPDPRPGRDHVLAHELAHLRQPLLRPRFLALSPDHAADADERRAAAATVEAARLGAVLPWDRVSDLPVAGRPSGPAAASSAPGGTAGTTGAVGVETVAPTTGHPQHWSPTTGFAPSPPTDGAIPPSDPDARSAVLAAAPTVGAPAVRDAATVLPATTVDQIVDALRDRVLHELERRGGRYAEVF